MRNRGGGACLTGAQSESAGDGQKGAKRIGVASRGLAEAFFGTCPTIGA